MKRTGRRVALLGWYPEPDPALPPYIPNMGLYMVAAALNALDLPDLELKIWDESGRAPGEVAEEILAFDPDIIGGSAFLWSLPKILQVIDTLAADDPHRLIVLGGPSARANMLAHAPFAASADWVDLLVEGDGEATFAEVVSDRRRTPEVWATIRGLRINSAAGFVPTGARDGAVMQALASPYQQGLIPGGGIGLMETYRGCPFSCSFCEWGVMEAPRNVRGPENILQEFAAMERLGLRALLLADAGLNLNNSGFESLRKAAAQTDFLKTRAVICEVYPNSLREAHLEFLGNIGSAHIGVGLQSFDPAVLEQVERRYDAKRFPSLLAALRSVASVTVEMIMGLPGDSPDGFWRNYERARELGTGLRVYHCAVLPSALMARSPVEHALDYDPVTLKMRSCLGWSRAEMARTVDRLTLAAQGAGGAGGDYFWVFPPA